MNDLPIRIELLAHAQRMNALDINQGKSGNVSVRCGVEGTFLITPSGVAYDAMGPDDLVVVRGDGTFDEPACANATAERRPSSEWRLHRDIYQRRREAGAVVHAHAMFATTLSCLDRPIPAFHYMVAAAGGIDIRCAPYATFGTQELSDGALSALEGRTACLHSHHGMTAFAESLPAALALAVEVETLAAMYWRALQIGSPTILGAAEMAVVLEKFRDYGKPRVP